MLTTDTIAAISTPPGSGGIAVIRLSGSDAFEIADKVFKANSNKSISESKSHSIHYGDITDGEEHIDDVLVSIFKSPNSYTGEDSVEISCHGSVYIQQRILELVLKNGARLAEPGEFTRRAFLNGRMDLVQAEAVADLIASQSAAAHSLAVRQMRGGFSKKIQGLRKQMLDLTALLELELDFAEEDVEFAGREQLKNLLFALKVELEQLINSFAQGNVLKHGIPVAIIGKPNVGKSTLLNALVNEEKAIVSEIPGTTRDVIEDVVNLRGVAFRFIDTAGIRQSQDKIESIGIERTYQMIDRASVVLFVFDIGKEDPDDILAELEDFKEHIEDPNKHFIVIGNKTDELIEAPHHFSELVELETIFISAKRKENLNLVADSLLRYAETQVDSGGTIVSSTRHHDALRRAHEAVLDMEKGLEQGIATDLFTSDMRMALHHLGQITGEVTNDEILGNIFENFCIGK